MPKAEGPTSEDGMREMPPPMPLPTTPGVLLTNLAMVPPPEMIPVISSVPDKLAEAWEAVKDDPRVAESPEADTICAFSVPRLLRCVLIPSPR